MISMAKKSTGIIGRAERASRRGQMTEWGMSPAFAETLAVCTSRIFAGLLAGGLVINRDDGMTTDEALDELRAAMYSAQKMAEEIVCGAANFVLETIGED